MTLTEDPPTTAAPEKEVGKARRRKEDARLITGKTLWTDNLVLPGMLHIAVVRSPVAHGKLTNVASTLQDLSKGRRTEIDHLNGAVAALGEGYGIDCPVNRALTAIIKALEAQRGAARGHRQELPPP